MIIKADKEGMKTLEQLADIALRQGGLQNLNAVNQFLKSIQPIEETEQNDNK